MKIAAEGSFSFSEQDDAEARRVLVQYVTDSLFESLRSYGGSQVVGRIMFEAEVSFA